MRTKSTGDVPEIDEEQKRDAMKEILSGMDFEQKNTIGDGDAGFGRR